VLVFVRHISTRPETWLDFPLFISERYADGKVRPSLLYLALPHLISSHLFQHMCCKDAQCRPQGRTVGAATREGGRHAKERG
jgi:hypothetical protein